MAQFRVLCASDEGRQVEVENLEKTFWAFAVVADRANGKLDSCVEEGLGNEGGFA